MWGNPLPRVPRRIIDPEELSHLVDAQANVKVYACPECKRKDFILRDHVRLHQDLEHPPEEEQLPRKRRRHTELDEVMESRATRQSSSIQYYARHRRRRSHKRRRKDSTRNDEWHRCSGLSDGSRTKKRHKRRRKDEDGVGILGTSSEIPRIPIGAENIPSSIIQYQGNAFTPRLEVDSENRGEEDEPAGSEQDGETDEVSACASNQRSDPMEVTYSSGSDWDQVIPYRKEKSQLFGNSKIPTDTARCNAAIDTANLDQTNTKSVHLETSAENENPIPPTEPDTSTVTGTIESLEHIDLMAELDSISSGDEIGSISGSEHSPQSRREHPIDDTSTQQGSSSSHLSRAGQSLDLSSLLPQPPLSTGDQGSDDEPTIIRHIPGKRLDPTNIVIKMEPGVTSDVVPTETAASHSHANPSDGSAPLQGDSQSQLYTASAALLRGRGGGGSRRKCKSSLDLGEARTQDTRTRSSKNGTTRSSNPDSTPPVPTVEVEISIRPDEIVLPIIYLQPNSEKQSEAPPLQTSTTSSPGLKREQETSDYKRGRGRASGKRRKKPSRLIAKCNFCSTALEEPIAQSTLKDRNRYYPATCRKCEGRFFALGLHVTYRQDLYFCGICGIMLSGLAKGMRHLQIHTTNKVYEVKPSADFYVVNVVNKSEGWTPPPRVKSEPVIRTEADGDGNSAHCFTSVSPTAANVIDEYVRPSTANLEENLNQNESVLSEDGRISTSSDSEAEPSRTKSTKSAEDPKVKLKQGGFICQEPNCRKYFRSELSLNKHSMAHRLNMSALWSKMRNN